MRFRDLQKQPSTISELYVFLEESALDLDYNWDFVEALSKLKSVSTDLDDLQCIQWELACFGFEFRGASLFSLAYGFDVQAEKARKYPSAEDFEKAGFQYLIGRKDAVKNRLLNARIIIYYGEDQKVLKSKFMQSMPSKATCSQYSNY